MIINALGNPLDFVITGGQTADCTQAITLLQHKNYQGLLADKGYDSNAIIDYVVSFQAMVIIPPKKIEPFNENTTKIFIKRDIRLNGSLAMA